jgi:hypothetical protein
MIVVKATIASVTIAAVFLFLFALTLQGVGLVEW